MSHRKKSIASLTGISGLALLAAVTSDVPAAIAASPDDNFGEE